MTQPIELPDEAIALNIYRIAQEALTNAIKHADAKNIVVKLKKSRGTLQLAVEDDGKGFQREETLERSWSPHHGLSCECSRRHIQSRDQAEGHTRSLHYSIGSRREKSDCSFDVRSRAP